MEPFTAHTGIVLPLDRIDVDTDQIIPKQFLKSIARVGFETALFYDWRYLADGSPSPAFVLNDPRYAGASVLATGRNFGSGSSREHAVWALQQYGFRALVAPSFADIFRNNCHQNGLVPVVLPEAIVRRIIDRAVSAPGYAVSVDLAKQTVSDEDVGELARFDVDPSVKHKLLHGLDAIGLTLRQEAAIKEFEAHRPAFLPRTK